MTEFDRKDLRNAFGRFMTGVTIVTARTNDGQPVGFTANSFTSVSLDPPLLLVCPSRKLSSFETFSQCSHFAVNILADDQQAVSDTFACYDGDRFERVAHHAGPEGLPLINGASAQFSCATHQIIPAGDHCILLGEVIAFEHRDAGCLGYARGAYFTLTQRATAA
ncbi:MAG: flavin reductase family protein [Rhodobacteraceae bacterium]|nr:flavin reductase family protein [Paracoccaceae bacterium]